jgi:hypothetical protein
MKSSINILLCTAAIGMAQAAEPIVRLTLDDAAVVTVPVATNRVTTISFPGPITAIDAANVTADGKTPGEFQIAHTKGESFFSVRALAPKASANLNVRWDRRTYVFELVENNTPVLSLVMEGRSEPPVVAPAPLLTPVQLLSLLDKAKAFELLKRHYPDSVAQSQARTFGDKPQVSDFNDYEIRLEEVFRFDPQDTLVFHVTLRNKSDREIEYLPESFSVRVGNRLYSQSISDSLGQMPPKSDTEVYFAITGSPDGGRNELSLKNEFMIFVTRLAAPLPPDVPASQPHTNNPEAQP